MAEPIALSVFVGHVGVSRTRRSMSEHVGECLSMWEHVGERHVVTLEDVGEMSSNVEVTSATYRILENLIYEKSGTSSVVVLGVLRSYTIGVSILARERESMYRTRTCGRV
jgi:hypothetical protein